EIQKMVKDAELNAADDKKKLEMVQARNQGEAMVHGARKSLGDLGAGVDAGDSTRIESAIRELEEAIKGDDQAAIETRTATLQTASQQVAAKMQAAVPPKASSASAPADDDVVDADAHDIR
ncbi:MAG: Hsp70 family protein, partial [Ramlibacter sp.]